jgi:hypothetical protein
MLKTLRFMLAATMGVRLGANYEEERVLIGVAAGDDERLFRGAMKAAKECGCDLARIATGEATGRKLKGIVTAPELTPDEERRGGRIAARRMNELLGGKGKAGVIGGVAFGGGVLSGFMDEAGKFAGIEIVTRQAGMEDPAEASAVTRGLLADHPDLGGLFAVRPGITAGVVRSLQASGNRDVKAIGFGLTELLAKDCVEGWIDSLVGPDSFGIGYEAVRAIAKSGRATAPRAVVRLFSRENLES